MTNLKGSEWGSLGVTDMFQVDPSSHLGDVENFNQNCYASTFKEVGGAYCFGGVHPFVLPFVMLFDA